MSIFVALKIVLLSNIVFREIESCAHLFASLDACFSHLEKLVTVSEKGDLFPKDDYPQEEILLSSENINQYCFYGRCLGFQVRIITFIL